MSDAPTQMNPAQGPITAPVRIARRSLNRLRAVELLLVVLALIVSAVAIGLVQIGVNAALDFGLVPLVAVPAVLALALHVALRIVAPNADPFILPIALVLNGIGIAMIYRVDLGNSRIAAEPLGWGYTSVRQIVFTAVGIGLAVLVVCLLRNHRVLQRYTYVSMAASIALLLLPFAPGIGREVYGAQIWINVAGFNFQPGEIAKITLAVFFAGYLVTHREALSMVGTKVLGMTFPRVRDLGPILVIWAAAMAVLVYQRDLGTALLYFGLFLVMLYLATGRLSWVLLGVVLFGGGALVASQAFSHVNLRVRQWLDAFSPEMYNSASGGDSYQLVQGIFGLAQGGLVGTGLGLGRPNTVPLAESDFIITSLGEELGLAGLFAIFALYVLFVSRGFRIGFASQDDFGKLLGAGLAFVIALQVFIVVGGVTRVIPLTGLTTPFLAAGGSSLLANWIIAAILLRLSDSVRNQKRLVVDS